MTCRINVYVCVGFMPSVVTNETVKGGFGEEGVFGFLPST